MCESANKPDTQEDYANQREEPSAFLFLIREESIDDACAGGKTRAYCENKQR